MEITGKLKVKNDTKQVSDKFKSREFVLTTEESSKYPQQVSFQLTQDKCEIIDKYNIGDELKVQVNVRGREWTSPQGEIKYFNTLEAWKIEKLGATSSFPAVSNATTNEQTFVPSSGADDDLPF